MVIFPAGAPVVPFIWASFSEEKDQNKVILYDLKILKGLFLQLFLQIPAIQKAKSLGGWVTVQNTIKNCSYHSDLQTITTPLITSGFLYHTLIQFGELNKELPVEFWEKLLTFTRAKPHPALKSASLVVMPMGGKQETNDPDGTQTCIAKSIRQARYFAIMEIYWKPEFGEDGKNVAREWAKGVTAIIKPYNNEALRYAAADNSVGTADIIERDQSGYGMDKYPQLRQLKKKYDPTNLFKNTVNIAPAE